MALFASCFAFLTVVSVAALQAKVRELPAETRADGAVVPARRVQVNVPVAHTTQFILHVASEKMIDFVSTAWKHFQEFFGLLYEFGKLGRAQRRLLHDLEVDLLLLDTYVGKESPLALPGARFESRGREVMGNKSYSPDFTRLLDTVSLMVRASRACCLSCAPPCSWRCLQLRVSVWHADPLVHDNGGSEWMRACADDGAVHGRP
jgi:hypothetical protein